VAVVLGGQFGNGLPTNRIGGSNTDFLAGLEGPKRDAAAALIALFKQYGLESLAGQIVSMIQAGEAADTITLRLQETPEYKQRFAGNEARRAKGLPVLSPAEYISTERSYRQIMAGSGLPIGFYDTPADFQSFLENDIAPTELKARVDQAFIAMDSFDKPTLDYFRQHYTTGEIAAFFLDPNKAQPLIDQAFRSSQIGGAAARNGVGGVDAERLAKLGVTGQQADQGFAQIGQELPTLTKLNDIYGGDYAQQDLVQEVFQGDAAASTKRRKLQSQERAAFSGQSGTGKTSLQQSGSGSI
jgi:hypothetical protein